MCPHAPCSGGFRKVVRVNVPWKSHIVYAELELKIFSTGTQGQAFDLGIPPI